MQSSHIFIFFIISMGIFLMPLIASKLKIPGAVSEMLYGVVIGQSILNLVPITPENRWIDIMADFGFIILMFLAGLEINFNVLKKRGIKSLRLPILSFMVSFTLAIMVVILFDLNSSFIFILSATGIGLIIPVMKELNIENTNPGQELFIFALIAELLTLITFTLFEFYTQSGLSLKLLYLPMMVLVSYLILKSFYVISWWFPEKVSNWIHPRDSRESGLRMAFTMMFMLVLFAVLFHIEHIIGAFIAGMIIAFTFRNKGTLEEKLNGFGYGFFIPIFFISVGLHFDLQSVLTLPSLKIFIYLLILGITIKLISSLLLIPQGISIRNALASGLMLAAPLTLLVALGMILLDLNMITTVAHNAIIFLAMVTGVMNPVLFKILRREEEEF